MKLVKISKVFIYLPRNHIKFRVGTTKVKCHELFKCDTCIFSMFCNAFRRLAQ